jgi:hypothetical protein
MDQFFEWLLNVMYLIVPTIMIGGLLYSWGKDAGRDEGRRRAEAEAREAAAWQADLSRRLGAAARIPDRPQIHLSTARRQRSRRSQTACSLGMAS